MYVVWRARGVVRGNLDDSWIAVIIQTDEIGRKYHARLLD
jgi:hypothetical protein